MNSVGHALRRTRGAMALAFGVWAAAITLAPGFVTKLLLAAPALALPLVWWVLQERVRWARLFIFAAILLPPLPLVLGDSGPHLAVFAAALGVLAGVLWLREWRIPPSGPAGAMVALLFVVAASLAPAAIHSGAEAGLASAARVALFAIAPFVFLSVAHGPADVPDPASEVRRLYWIAEAAALFACLDFYFQFPPPAGFGPQYVWLESGVYRRAQGLFYEASTLGNFCVFFLVMIAAAWTRPARELPLKRAALAVGAPVLMAALVLSYSRGSVVALAVALAMLAWLNRGRFAIGRLAAAVALGGTISAWLVWKAFPAFAEFYWFRLSTSAQYLFTSTEGVLSGRVASWQSLTGWMAAHPWQLLLGVGYKTLPYTQYLGSTVVPDNMYLSLLVETGVIGLAALLWLNTAILRAALRSARSRDPVRAFLGTWMFCFWAGESVQMLSGDLLTYWRVLPVYFFVLAMAVRG